VGVGDRLRDLDARVLPPLARTLARVGSGPARLRLLTSIALLSVCAVVVTAAWTADRAPVADRAAPDVVRVGVVEGQTVGGYVGASRTELAALARDGSAATAEVYALVTLVTYLAPERLTSVLDGVAVAEVYVRAPLPGMQSQVVRIAAYRIPQDVVTGMLDTARRREQETADYLQLRDAHAGQTEGDVRLRAAYELAARTATAEATAYRVGCSCVYAAVVRATPGALTRLAGRPAVRAVDPAPEVHGLDQVEFLPPLPEPAGGRPTGSAPASPRPAPAPIPSASPMPAPVTSASAESSVTPSTSSGSATEAPSDVPSSEPTSPVETASP
jgi:hypothetical protein